MVAMLVVIAVPAFAEPTTCQSTLNANPSAGGNAEHGATGDRSRTFAEQFEEDFGQGTASTAQQAPADCSGVGLPGPPGAFDPTQT